MSEILFMTEIEQAEDEYLCGRIDEAEFRRRMRKLGFKPREIDDELERICG